jgi:hypothetical protein
MIHPPSKETMEDNTVIETTDLHKEYKRDEFKIVALQNANMQIKKGAFVALMALPVQANPPCCI